MPASTSDVLRVAVIADSDTRWKWGALTARRLSVGDTRLSGFLLRGRATPTPRQLAEAGSGVDPGAVREVTGAEFLRAVESDGYDVVVLALVGGAVQAMLHGLAALGQGLSGPGRRPVVVTGYVGVVYEKLADGLLLRHGADVVLANSLHDAERFRAVYEGVGADASAVTGAALPFLGGAPYAGGALRTVVFAAQPSVPASREGRTYLLRRLAEHARLHPDREVLLKLRSQPGEHTTHIEELPYQKLAEKLPGGLPANLRLVYGHMGEVLDRTDLLVTVSSTAALESLHRRIPTAVLTDLGIREALGNHHFLGSGCLVSWDQLDSGTSPEPDPAWLARQGVAAGGPAAAGDSYGSAGASYDTAFDAVRERVARLLLDPRLPPIEPYYTLTTAPGYLPGILARYRLDAAPAAEPGGVRRVVRDAVRDAARGAYRHGVQRVAPVIRRMGEL
ncbi:DUF6716 putative glycosyltransferase [Streptomyces sp. NPDC059398]|uniref:DUF6716 putative glycosyltransferase n=1 Tax=Streptomyces sp. NPDC059398 TaxID=3346820 RepID=UPI0036A4B33C